MAFSRSENKGVSSTRASKPKVLARSGPPREWHGDFTKSFEHAAFDLRPGSRQVVVPPVPPLGHPRLEPVRSVGDAVGGDRVQDLLIERRPVGRAAVALEGDQR